MNKTRVSKVLEKIEDKDKQSAYDKLALRIVCEELRQIDSHISDDGESLEQYISNAYKLAQKEYLKKN
jgi:hypothetical protein